MGQKREWGEEMGGKMEEGKVRGMYGPGSGLVTLKSGYLME